MRLDHACERSFARHETFDPRYGWIKKGFDAAAEDPDLFNKDIAVVRLGVGKNMVRSIRFWGQAFKVLSKSADKTPKAVPSNIGNALFARNGWDPYGELAGTQWLLHWWLLAPDCLVPTWWLAFNEFPGVDFTAEQLEQFVSQRVRDWDVHPSSIRKDVACLLRMYAGSTSVRSGIDELAGSPARELGLISVGAEPGSYRMHIGSKPTLPPSIVAFACLDFAARSDRQANTVSVSQLVSDPGGPGKAFKLTEASMLQLLDSAARLHPEQIQVTSNAGAPQLAARTDLIGDGSLVLQAYYQRFASSKSIRPASLCGRLGSSPAEAKSKRSVA